jgi:hypothetical protein
MIGKALEVSGMSISVSVDGGAAIELDQIGIETLTVNVDEFGSAISVYADEGLSLTNGTISVNYKPGVDVTHLFDRRELSKKLREAE